MLSITKTFRFEAGHHLPYHDGACKREHGHGYKLEVTVTGPVVTSEGAESPPADAGMVMDFSVLKSAVDTWVISILDHSNLNKILTNPTAENLMLFIHSKLDERFGTKLVRLRLWETEGSYVEWTRDCK